MPRPSSHRWGRTSANRGRRGTSRCQSAETPGCPRTTGLLRLLTCLLLLTVVRHRMLYYLSHYPLTHHTAMSLI